MEGEGRETEGTGTPVPDAVTILQTPRGRSALFGLGLRSLGYLTPDEFEFLHSPHQAARLS